MLAQRLAYEGWEKVARCPYCLQNAHAEVRRELPDHPSCPQSPHDKAVVARCASEGQSGNSLRREGLMYSESLRNASFDGRSRKPLTSLFVRAIRYQLSVLGLLKHRRPNQPSHVCGPQITQGWHRCRWGTALGSHSQRPLLRLHQDRNLSWSHVN